MSPKSPQRYSKINDGRFGYRATPERRQPTLQYQQGRREKQEFLDRINYDRLTRGWRQERIEKGRAGWNDLGNNDLPIWKHKQDIMRMVASNRISLLAGETGSGKSTQLAQYALEMGYDRVVYLQPRRVTADNISDRLESELLEQFNQRGIEYPDGLVGVSHSERSTMRSDSVVQVMTSAVYKKRAIELEEAWKDERVLIVADEVHEGNIETEFAVATAAEQMERQQRWNMVLMSATLNEGEIQDAYASLNGSKIPSVTVEGRPHTIESHERCHDTVVDVFVDECLKSGNKTLIFTDGKRSLKAIKDEIERRCGSESVEVLLLHSKIDEASRRQIFHIDAEEGVHRVIVSTSAGQSGITIPGVDRVISDGWTKSPELDAENASGLPRRLCSRAELIQQMGRGGRDIDGAKFYLAKAHPYKKRPGAPEDIFCGFISRKREEHIPADIYHTVITRNVLSAAAMKKDFYALNDYLIHKVTFGTIKEAYSILQLLGAVDARNKITDVGSSMDRLPLRPELSRAVVASEASDEQTYLQALAITASIEAGGLGSYVAGTEWHNRLSTDTHDDFIAELDLFLAARRHMNADDTDEVDMQPDGIDTINAIRAHKQFAKMCRQLKISDDAVERLTNTMTVHHRKKLHELFLLGMPHLLYEEVSRSTRRGRRVKNPDGTKQPQKVDIWYRNILGPPKGSLYTLDRRVGRASVLSTQLLPPDTMVAGYPRWYTTDDGEVKNVIQQGFPTTKNAVKRILGGQALDIRDYTTIGPDGRLQLVRTGHIGRLTVSHLTEKTTANSHGTIHQLVEQALQTPGPAQRDLRKLKRTLEDLAERVPVQRRQYFFKNPVLIGDGELRSIVRAASRNVGSLGELDARIRQRGITLQDYIDDDRRETLEEYCPRELHIGPQIYDLIYEGDEAQPIVILSENQIIDGLAEGQGLFLKDGREVLFRRRGGSDQLFSARSL